jgi:transposase-like protein
VKERRTLPGEVNLESPTTGLEVPPSGKGTPMLKVLEGGKSEKGKEAEKEGKTEGDGGRARAAVATVAAGDAVLPMDLDEITRDGARLMLMHALQIEAQDYVARHAGERGRDGRALVVGNGRGKARHVTTGSGTFEVRAPRVNDKRVIDGERQRFRSRILPPYMRRSPKVDAVLPLLYLHGLSTGDFKPALHELLGQDAAGLSPTAITRLTTVWQGEYETWRQRSLAELDFVYVWVDGVHFNIRLEEDPLAALVVVGVRPDGTKELIAVEDGYRESEEAWASLLRDLKDRGMRAPVLAVGDGALGFWKAKREVWPETREQRCWFHRLGNILDKLPKRVQGEAKKKLHEVMYAEARTEAEAAITRFAAAYGAAYPKAVKCLEEDKDTLLAFFDYPADHWKHLRTTNPIESTFSTVRLRTRVTKGAGSRRAGLAMTFKLLRVAEQTWRRIDGQELVPLVRAGVRFVDGKRVEREDQEEKPEKKPDITTKEKRRRAAA